VDGEVMVLRDQKPLNIKKLESCLVDMTVEEWLALLNRKVFFWPTQRRCEELSRARAYRDSSHLVLEVDTSELIRRYPEGVTFAPINTGSVLYTPRPRGRNTFRGVGEYGRIARVAEVAVDYAVPDVAEFTLAWWRIRAGEWVD
jgi:hypothetical protein